MNTIEFITESNRIEGIHRPPTQEEIVEYETLHPFTDGNGRSGRALWAWHMMNTKGGYPLGFLHHFYYQSLDAGRK